MKIKDCHIEWGDIMHAFAKVISTDDISIAYYLREYRNIIVPNFLHKHNEYYEFIIFLDTAPVFIYDNYFYLGLSTVCYIIDAGTEHGFPKELDFDFISIVFKKRFFDSVRRTKGLPRKKLRGSFELNGEFFKTLRRFTHTIEKVYSNPKYVTKIQRLFVNMMIDLVYNTTARRVKPRKMREKDFVIEYAYDIADYSQNEFIRRPLAPYTEYNHRKAYDMMFKSCFNLFPATYLRYYRISQGKTLLRDTNMNVKKICSQIGYHNRSAFNRSFKKIVGYSPGEYRKLFKRFKESIVRPQSMYFSYENKLEKKDS